MSQIAAVEAALKASGEQINRPWPEWGREDKSDETFFLYDDHPLTCVVMEEEVLGALTEDEAKTLAGAAAVDEGELSSVELGYLSEIYHRPTPTSSS